MVCYFIIWFSSFVLLLLFCFWPFLSTWVAIISFLRLCFCFCDYSLLVPWHFLDFVAFDTSPSSLLLFLSFMNNESSNFPSHGLGLTFWRVAKPSKIVFSCNCLVCLQSTHTFCKISIKFRFHPKMCCWCFFLKIIYLFYFYKCSGLRLRPGTWLVFIFKCVVILCIAWIFK